MVRRRLLGAAAIALALPVEASGVQALPPEVGELRYARTLGNAEAFGRVTDVAALPEGLVAVLDGMQARVTLFGPEGEVLGVRGERGRGPREFFTPMALAVRGESLLVLDRGNHQIAELSTGSDTLAWQEERAVPLASPHDICVADDRLFLLGSERGSLVHELNRAGEIVRSFGAVPGDDPMGGRLAAVGSLVCSPSGWVAVLSELLNHVAVFSLEGERLWNGDIPDFERQEYDTTGGVLRPLPPSQGYHHEVVSARATAGRFLDVQLGRSPSGPESVALESRRLDISSGEWVPSGRGWPRLLAVSGDSYLFYEENPFPLVKVYR